MNVKHSTNPRYKTFDQAMFTAGDVDQFQSSRSRIGLIEREKPNFSTNVFEGRVLKKKIWSKYADLDSRAVINTFNYIFYKLKKGIFVRIFDNRLETFLPFSNAHYKNEFGHLLKVDPRFGSVTDFLVHVAKLLGYRYKSQPIRPFDEWVANNALVRYDENEGDNNVAILYDMFQKLCEKRKVPDIEFFVNRRDSPLMKLDGTEPYYHIFGDSQHLLSHEYDKYCPILSGSTSERFADLPFPTYEDWARAVYQETGKTFPNNFREYPIVKSVSWKDKIPVAVFRGATTGYGVDPFDNQRLRAFEIGQKNKSYMDVGFTKWNLRPRKLEGKEYLQTIERSSYPISSRLSLEEQSRFKYILNLEGHVAAYRLSYELSSGSVVLLAESKWKMWYYPFIKPYVHYVPVKEDLSDLIYQIEWCRSHDEECRIIAANAKRFYEEYLGTKGVLDFLQKELWEISETSKTYDYLPDLLVKEIESEKLALVKETKYGNKVYRFPAPSSPRCIGQLDGCAKVLKNVKLSNLVWDGLIFQNVNGRIDRFRLNNVIMVGKRASHDAKKMEHVHENYIGTKSVNKMVARIPNFAYVMGTVQDAPDMVFIEYVKGKSMINWLKSDSYNFRDLLSILVQLNLSLYMAQNYVGFIHYDLYPWNIMIQKLEEENYHGKDFHYFLKGNKSNVVSISPTVIPIMIDYGKSRAIVYEKEYGTVDHGFSNLYKQNAIVDSLTILYGTLCVLKDANKLGPKELRLLDFPKKLALKNHEDVKRWCKYGALFDFKPKISDGKTDANPKNFVDFVMMTFVKDKPDLKTSQRFVSQMEKGINPVVYESAMEKGNPNDAFLELIKMVDSSRSPICDSTFFQNFVSNNISRRLKWIDLEIESRTSNKIREYWKAVRKMLMAKNVATKYVDFSFPKPKALWLDDEITPRYLKGLKVLNIPASEDWMSTWILCLESVLLYGYEPMTKDMEPFLSMNGFLYQNAIASNNTVEKLRKDEL